MRATAPSVVVIAGPNGAGKSTAAPALLHGSLQVSEFVNADVIARGLSAFAPETVAVEAGRVMLRRLDELAAARASFAFETTLASRSFAPRLAGLSGSGYECHIIFLSLPSTDVAVARVAKRVESGGHGVPEVIIRRRFERGLRNFFTLYQPLATTWLFYDNADPLGPRLIASGAAGEPRVVADEQAWDRVTAEYEPRQRS